MKTISFSKPYVDEEEIKAVAAVLRSSWLTTGPKATEFEEKVKEFTGAKHAIAVSSCTVALEISLAVHGIGPGDKVITTAYTFISTVLSIIHRGATPVFIDIEPDTFNIDPAKIEEIIKKSIRIKAIIPVHFAGQPCNMTEINRIAREYNLVVIEDAAHALGASHQGIMIGKSENLICFSFYANKNITTGEGGMIVTDNDELALKARIYSNHGITKNAYERQEERLPFCDVIYPGFKANLPDILAAIGVVQMEKIKEITAKRNQIATWYDNFLFKSKEIIIPAIKNYNYSSRHLYPILIRESCPLSRNFIFLELKERNIFPSIHFDPVHCLTIFREGKLTVYSKLPIAENISLREMSLPIYPAMTLDDVEYVSENLKEILKKC